MPRWCAVCSTLAEDAVCKGTRAVSTIVVERRGTTTTLVDLNMRACGAKTVPVRDVYVEGKRKAAK